MEYIIKVLEYQVLSIKVIHHFQKEHPSMKLNDLMANHTLKILHSGNAE